MPFGHLQLKRMKKRSLLYIAAITLAVAGCKEEDIYKKITISPDAGTTVKAGESVTIKVSYPDEIKPDSIVYLLDSTRLEAKKDASPVVLKTDSMPLGPKSITASFFQPGKQYDKATNIVVLAARAPETLSFKVDKVYPHDVTSYTEGLEYHDGYLYESDGGYLDPPPGDEKIGPSSLRKVDLTTGKVLQSVENDPKVFAEGITVIGDKIVQLTYKEKIGYVYDKSTFKLLKTFNNNVGIEGWGMTFDGNKIYMDDSTNRLWFLDKETYQQIGYVDVYDDKGPVNSINELEYIDGKIYANVFQEDYIVVIDPKTGAVLQKIDFKSLYPKRNKEADVFNGIAWDAKGKRLFVTGKFWDKLFQVSLVKK